MIGEVWGKWCHDLIQIATPNRNSQFPTTNAQPLPTPNSQLPPTTNHQPLTTNHQLALHRSVLLLQRREDAVHGFLYLAVGERAIRCSEGEP